METSDQLLQRCYWLIRDVLTVADASLVSPHPVWSSLNEMLEIIERLENHLQIANRYEHGV